MAVVELLSRSVRPCESTHAPARTFSQKVISNIIYYSRCGMSDVAFCTAPPIGGPSCVKSTSIADGSLKSGVIRAIKTVHGGIGYLTYFRVSLVHNNKYSELFVFVGIFQVSSKNINRLRLLPMITQYSI